MPLICDCEEHVSLGGDLAYDLLRIPAKDAISFLISDAAQYTLHGGHDLFGRRGALLNSVGLVLKRIASHKHVSVIATETVGGDLFGKTFWSVRALHQCASLAFAIWMMMGWTGRAVQPKRRVFEVAVFGGKC